MARKNVVPSFQMIDSGDASADILSNSTSVINHDKADVRIEWTGSPVGEIIVQAQQRSDLRQPIVEGDWFDIEFGNTITVDGSNTNHHLKFNELPFTDIRIKYTSTSGSGTINAKITLKQIGG